MSITTATVGSSFKHRVGRVIETHSEGIGFTVMGLILGMDEAGYGPNLGPLVVTVTAWEVPGLPHEFDFWGAMSEIASQSPTKELLKLQIADSKQVYSPGKGLAVLEKSVLSGLRLLGRAPKTFQDLSRDLIEKPCADRPTQHGDRSLPPWLVGRDRSLPAEVEPCLIADIATQWQDCCRRAGVELHAIRSAIVQPKQFNALVRDYDNKSLALSRISLNLLRSVWNPDDTRPTLVTCDKHGGRNRYGDLLAEVLDGRLVFSAGESQERSVYRVNSTELRFQMRAEANFPVAMASLVCKYVREQSMELFNQFWSEHVPGVKPTAGYPVDAARFQQDIAAAQARLGIPRDVLWRER